MPRFSPEESLNFSTVPPLEAYFASRECAHSYSILPRGGRFAANAFAPATHRAIMAQHHDAHHAREDAPTPVTLAEAERAVSVARAALDATLEELRGLSVDLERRRRGQDAEYAELMAQQRSFERER